MYSTMICPYCFAAKKLLNQLSLEFNEIRVDKKPEMKQEMISKSGRFTVPQIFINKKHIGGYTDLVDYHKSGKLKKLVEKPA